MLMQFLIYVIGLVFAVGSIGAKDPTDRSNFTKAFIACLAAIAIINIFN